jgi:hypothetical protein
MTREDIRQALLEEMSKPNEVRTNDGRVLLVHGVEQWALGSGRLAILEGAGLTSIAIRNIASIGRPAQRRRRRA